MNIAIINQWYFPKGGGGGIAKYNYYLAKTYCRLGHKVFVVSALGPGDKKIEAYEGIQIYRIKQVTFPWFLARMAVVGGFLRFFRDALYSFSAQRVLVKLDKDFKIDLVEYAEINSEGFFHAVFGPKKIPLIVRCHTPYLLLKDYYTKAEFSFSSPLIYWMERTFIRKAQHLTAPSEDLRRIIGDRFQIKEEDITTVPNLIDSQKFSPQDIPGSDPGKIKILYVGRLERGKGVFVLAEAIKKINIKSKEKLEFIFVGPNRMSSCREPGHETLKEFLSPEIKAKIVIFKGEISESELIKLYNESDIFVNPSLIYESFSYTCLEASSCGKPSIASRIGGIPEVVKDEETGFLFSPGDSGQLAGKLELLINNPDKRMAMGQAARQRVKEKFEALKVAKINLEVYRQIVTENK